MLFSVMSCSVMLCVCCVFEFVVCVWVVVLCFVSLMCLGCFVLLVLVCLLWCDLLGAGWFVGVVVLGC